MLEETLCLEFGKFFLPWVSEKAGCLQVSTWGVRVFPSCPFPWHVYAGMCIIHHLARGRQGGTWPHYVQQTAALAMVVQIVRMTAPQRPCLTSEWPMESQSGLKALPAGIAASHIRMRLCVPPYDAQPLNHASCPNI